jgi:predicted phosphodiesterase
MSTPYTLPPIQYASDLHLEFFPETKAAFEDMLKPVAPILVLAGDIGYPGAQRTRDFMAWCSERWRHVIWVFGNHEYYALRSQKNWKHMPAEKLPKMEEREALTRVWLSALPNVHFLQAETIELEGILFFGATLWTAVTDELHAAEGDRITDFRCIVAERDASGGAVAITNPFRNAIHKRHLAALEAAVKATEAGKPIIVVTHHLPTQALAPAIYAGLSLNPYYSNELWDLLRSKQIAAWICGHSHGRSILEKPTLCVLNARGYPGQQGPQNPYVTTAVLSLPVPDA